MSVAWIDEAGRIWVDGVQHGAVGPAGGEKGVANMCEMLGCPVPDLPPWFFSPAYKQAEKERRADELAKRAWDLHRQGYPTAHIMKACGWKTETPVLSAIRRFEVRVNR